MNRLRNLGRKETTLGLGCSALLTSLCCLAGLGLHYLSNHSTLSSPWFSTPLIPFRTYNNGGPEPDCIVSLFFNSKEDYYVDMGISDSADHATGTSRDVVTFSAGTPLGKFSLTVYGDRCQTP